MARSPHDEDGNLKPFARAERMAEQENERLLHRSYAVPTGWRPRKWQGLPTKSPKGDAIIEKMEAEKRAEHGQKVRRHQEKVKRKPWLQRDRRSGLSGFKGTPKRGGAR